MVVVCCFFVFLFVFCGFYFGVVVVVFFKSSSTGLLTCGFTVRKPPTGSARLQRRVEPQHGPTNSPDRTGEDNSCSGDNSVIQHHFNMCRVHSADV